MRKARWLAPWRNSAQKPVFYHCISRVVDRRHAFGAVEKEKFRALMRVYEQFSGCRVVAYCVMCNHFHLLLEVPPFPAAGFSDKDLLRRIGAISSDVVVAEVAIQLAEARKAGTPELAEAARKAIHDRYTYRMHDLGEFMKGLLQRFTQWFNRTHSRSGRLWEDRFKSVIVEDGTAARTIAAYIDLNPVRAGMAKDPANYRWSSYGEAIGGGTKGHGRSARAGLVRAWGAHQGCSADADQWPGDLARQYRRLLLEGPAPRSAGTVTQSAEDSVRPLRNGRSKSALARERVRDGEIPFARMLRHRIRYFSDGAVIGTRDFVDETFLQSRSRFGVKRQTGARRLRGNAAAAAGFLWSFRDLQKGIG